MRFNLLIFIALAFICYSNAQEASCACCTDKHQEFSFWEGEWEVSLPNGTKAGENSINRIQDKCILEENWVSATLGYTGTSHSFYNSFKQQWEQLWIDNKGASLHLKGHKTGNKMILSTDEAVNKDGNKFVNRLTWIQNSDGTVRQLWEVITQTESGEKISIAFNGLYRRKG